MHTNLMASKIIPDPYIGTNELAGNWLGTTT